MATSIGGVFISTVAVVVGVLPLVLPSHLAHDGARIGQVVVLTSAAAFMCLQAAAAHRQRAGVDPLHTALLVAVVVLAGVSVARSAHPSIAAQELALMAGLASLAAAFRRLALPAATGKFWTCLVIGQLVYLAVSLGVFVAALANHDPLDARSFHLGFGNPRFLNHVQTLAIPLLVGISIASPKRWVRFAAVMLAGFHTAWLFFDLARASLVALAASTAWLFYCSQRGQSLRTGVVAALGVSICLIVFVAIPHAMGRHWTSHFASARELGSSHSRDQLISAAWALASEHPWLGSGPMHFAHLNHAKGSHPHNAYLQWAAELGWPAMLLLLLLLLIPLWRLTSRLRSAVAGPSAMHAAAGAAMVAALVDAGFSGNFVMPISQLWIALAVGVLMQGVAGSTGPHGQVHGRWRLVAWLLILATQLWLCRVTWEQWQYDPPRLDAHGIAAQTPDKERPRFWLRGGF